MGLTVNREKGTHLGKLPPQYTFILNPYTDARFSRCPMCDQKMHQRKVPLFIHVDPFNPVVLGYTCRYCLDCDLLIAHQDQIEALLANLFAERDPSVIGNDYLVIGTVERTAWREGMKQPKGIDDMLAMVIPNAYPHYRDLGLVALASACLAVPDVDWVRVRLQAILAVALDREGVIFALDLPSILEGEAARRGMDAGLPGLQDVRDYLTAAAAGDDQWGTAMRAGSARAAALFWQGRREDAFDELIKASQCDGGFAGFGTLSLLALASRCHEFGDPARTRQPIWGREGNVSLLDGAQGIAGRVHADSFRQERLALVDSYLTWMAEDAPDLRALHNKLSTVPDPDVRRAYKDLASARWASPAGRDEVSLAGLIPIVLNDGSTLDALLGRWIGPRLARLPDAELAEAIRQCAAGLLDLRPWELGYSGEAGEALRHLY